jgi:L-ornithine Nalpha-acyltransferase
MNLAVSMSEVHSRVFVARSAERTPRQTFGLIGSLRVKLAETPCEVDAAIALRSGVFRQLMPAGASSDRDRFDAVCDHLLVLDEALPGPAAQRAVGTYRLLRSEAAMLSGGFYSECEFEVSALIKRHPGRRFLELGRSCVLPAYRSKRTAELLWQGIWDYCRAHAIDVMFGCASFAGTAPARHALPLSFLYHHARACGEWAVEPVSKLAVLTDLVPAEAIASRPALAAMPPLVKGYLRLGAKFSDRAVIDPDFGTTDVLVILRTEDISARHLNHYGQDADRFA